MRPSITRSPRRPLAQRAFTFLEIMFVVVIIGILLAIVGPRLAGKSQKARIAACQTQIRNIGVALSQYELHVGSFPEDLKALIERPSDVDENDWDGPYLDGNTLPKDAWGNDFQYKNPGEHNKDYDLWSMGKDKQDNTEDDVKNWKDAEN